MDERMRDLERRAVAGDQEAFLELRRLRQRLRDPLRDPKPGDVVVAPRRGWDGWTHEQREKDERELLTGMGGGLWNSKRVEVHRLVRVPGYPPWGRLVCKVMLPDPEIRFLLEQPGTVWRGDLATGLQGTSADGYITREVSKDDMAANMKSWGGLVQWEPVSRWDVVDRAPANPWGRSGRASERRRRTCSLVAWRRWARGGRPVRDGLVLRMAEEIPAAG